MASSRANEQSECKALDDGKPLGGASTEIDIAGRRRGFASEGEKKRVTLVRRDPALRLRLCAACGTRSTFDLRK